MLSAQTYRPLSGKEGEESNVPLLNDPSFFHIKKQGGLSKWCHWVLHGISAFTIVGLLVILQFSAHTNRAKCWDMFNYYCKTAKKNRSSLVGLTTF